MAKKGNQNARTHGLTARNQVLSPEDEAHLHAHIETYIKEWEPCGQTELDLVRHMATCQWRLERISQIDLFSGAYSDADTLLDDPDLARRIDFLGRHEARLQRMFRSARVQVLDLMDRRVRAESDQAVLDEQQAIYDEQQATYDEQSGQYQQLGQYQQPGQYQQMPQDQQMPQHEPRAHEAEPSASLHQQSDLSAFAAENCENEGMPSPERIAEIDRFLDACFTAMSTPEAPGADPKNAKSKHAKREKHEKH
jgi:hypothetical protein